MSTMNNKDQNIHRERLSVLEEKYHNGTIGEDELLELGYEYDVCHQEEKALEIWQVAVLKHPDNVFAKIFLADFLMMDARSEQFLPQVRDLANAIVESGSDFGGAGYYFLAWAYEIENLSKRESRETEAIELLRLYDKALEINPDWPYLHYHRAEILQSMGRLKEALEAATKASDGQTAPDPAWPSYRSYIENLITGRCPSEYLADNLTKLRMKLEEELN
jgi:tetratricopeptide (TPR) repeat protein